MLHDQSCELNHRACRQCPVTIYTSHCHCASRAFPLCGGCQRGLHLDHRTTEPNTGALCACDLCSEEEAA